MKKRWNETYTTIALYVFFTAVAIGIVLAIVFHFSAVIDAITWIFRILSPFIWGLAIAYLINRPIDFFERKVFRFIQKKKEHSKFRRGLSCCIVLFLAFFVIIGIIYIVLPQLIENILTLIRKLPSYYTTFVNWVSGIEADLEIEIISEQNILNNWESLSSTIIDRLNSLSSEITSAGISYTINILVGLFNAFIALIASIYIQLSKEKFIMQTKKLLFAIFPEKLTRNFIKLLRETHHVFTAFISSKLIISLGIVLVIFLALLIMGIPYALFIGVISGIFNLIPYFGPILGAIPCVLVLLLIDPVYAIIYIALVVVTQFLDGQIFMPKLVGDTVGINPFWVMFAIIIGGAIAGIPGMILGVPFFSIVYTLIREFANSRLRKKGLSTKSKDYESERRGK